MPSGDTLKFYETFLFINFKQRFMKIKNTLRTITTWTITAGLSVILFTSCQKDIKNDSNVTAQQKIQLPLTANPYSLRNVQKAQQTLSEKNQVNSRINITGLPQYVYFKFDPNQLSQQLFKELENDSTVKLLDFPFANAALYNETFALDEDKKNQLIDGFIYGVTNIENTTSLPQLRNATSLTKQFIDTLGLIPEEDTALQFQAYREAGASESQIEALRICLFKRPHGYVRYWDEELPNGSGGFGRLEPVRGMQVWGLVFGIPIHSYTDANGNYQLPWRFSAGTIMGTHAKSDRVNVKPFNTIGPWYQVIPQLIINFVVGSVHIKGWVGACQMRDDVNFDFYGHTQVRYWSQILNGYYFDDIYTAQEGIYNAPNHMICYAHWADKGDFGSASTPMLYHETGGEYTDYFLENLLENPVTGKLLELLHGLLPDMTFRVCGNTAPQHYNSRLAQIVFHELGHASEYRKLGWGWYISMSWAEKRHWKTKYLYGEPGDNDNWGKVQVGESWAEYIGTEHALKKYGTTGWKYSEMQGNFINYPFALEYEDWFDNNWIPTGIYHDLIDTDTNPFEFWDAVGGSSIPLMYAVFNSNTNNMCDYREQFLSTYPAFDQTLTRNLFSHYRLECDK